MIVLLDKKLFAFLLIGFVIFTIIGTLAHEGGHFITAKALGFDATISYAFTNLHGEISEQEQILITSGGIMQTLLTGVFGLFLLVFYWKNFNAAVALNLKQWILIFVSLFWLRELFNFLTAMARYFILGAMPDQNDEVKLAVYFGLYPWLLSFILAFMAAAVLFFVIFKFIPLKQRFSFILSLLIGGSLGFFTWMYWLGPLLLP